jgi:hypothetical protein
MRPHLLAAPALAPTTPSDQASSGQCRPATTLVLLLGVTLGGCAGMFQERPYADAVETARLDGTTLRIVGSGNYLTSDERVHDYVLLKAAEETLAAGYGYFRILEEKDSSSIQETTTGGYSVVTDYNGKGDADDKMIYVPSQTSTTRLPGITLVVRMYKGPKPPDAPGNVYDAAEVATVVGPRVKGNASV